MYPLESKLENQTFVLNHIEENLKSHGFVIGPNWDFDHGSFDLLMANDHGYQYLRLPFKVTSGSLDVDGAVIQFKTPYLLTHVYNKGLDDNVGIEGNVTASINQFQEPIEPDANVPGKYQKKGREILKSVESYLT
ncbi:YugN-like family protein [Bacillus sp. JJ664]